MDIHGVRHMINTEAIEKRSIIFNIKDLTGQAKRPFMDGQELRERINDR
jgi:hypothetical protein